MKLLHKKFLLSINEVFQNLKIWHWPNKIQNAKVVVIGQLFFKSMNKLPIGMTQLLQMQAPVIAILWKAANLVSLN